VSRVAVIVLNWNGAAHLAPCLESVGALTYADREVVVVDNGSTDGSVDGLPVAFPWFRLIRHARNLGYAGGNNAGIRATQSDFVLLVNNDTVLAPGFLEPMVAACERDPRVAACSPRTVYEDRPSVINAAGLELKADFQPASRGCGEEDGPRFDTACEVFGAHGACVLYRRAALERVGLLDEDFFAYNEEFDLAWRLRLAGWTARYVPDARVSHREAASSRGMPDRILYLMERNRIWAMVKNAGAGLLARRLPALAGGEGRMVRHVLGIRTLTPLRARVDALLGLPKMLAKRREVQALRTVSDAEIERWMV
jgi:GT2 family glycosyltransferase